MTPRKAGSEEPPAPPPCEAYSAPIDDESEAPVLCQVHDRPIYICIEAKDAEIAELRALLAEYIDWHDDELGVDTPAEGNEPYWLERVRAALARSSEVPK